jgi:hypothetical protein
VDFSILAPPTALSEPVAPPRLLLILGVLVFGLGAGAAGAFLLSRLNPVFDSLTTMEAVTGLPVLGAVSVTWLDRRKHRRKVEVLRATAAGIALLVLFVGVVMTRDAGSRILSGLMG